MDDLIDGLNRCEISPEEKVVEDILKKRVWNSTEINQYYQTYDAQKICLIYKEIMKTINYLQLHAHSLEQVMSVYN